MFAYDWLYQQLSEEEREALSEESARYNNSLVEGINRIYTEGYTLHTKIHDDDPIMRMDKNAAIVEVLECAFVWTESQRGYAYWWAIANKYKIRAGRVNASVH